MEQKLLTMGGRQMVYMPSPSRLVRHILDHGQLFAGMSVKYVKGKPSRCHDNVDALWKKYPGTYAMCHGYALSDDGLWRQHSWLLEGKTIIETTIGRAAYYGVILNGNE